MGINATNSLEAKNAEMKMGYLMKNCNACTLPNGEIEIADNACPPKTAARCPIVLSVDVACVQIPSEAVILG